MPTTIFAPDAFGDRFDLAALPLPRRAEGYAVQKLDTDTLLDRETGAFLPVRSAHLRALFASFDEAHLAAGNWVLSNAPHDDPKLAIVPASFDTLLQRHVLIYGVLCGQP